MFLIWLYGGDDLIEFLNYVNSYHGQFKYTWEHSDKQITYLDVKVKIVDNKIITDVHSKETYSHQYLDHRSCHPKHVKVGIPYGQALRLR